MAEKKFTILDFQRKKAEKKKITMLTAYDFPMAKLLEEADIDAVLVGDSLAMVVLGYDSTVTVTMDEMIHHAKAVSKGIDTAFLIGDMPFLSYQVSDEEAVRNAGRFIKEAGCDAVKIEGGAEMVSRVRAIIDAGIPVLGHIGLTPQSVSKLGGFRVQGRDERSRKRLFKDADSLEKAGCFAIIMECMPTELAGKITGKLSVPTIGIGAGPHCDGQVLVTHDIIGYFDRFTPKFVKKYANVGKVITDAVKKFKQEVDADVFPDEEHSYRS